MQEESLAEWVEFTSSVVPNHFVCTFFVLDTKFSASWISRLKQTQHEKASKFVLLVRNPSPPLGRHRYISFTLYNIPGLLHTVSDQWPTHGNPGNIISMWDQHHQHWGQQCTVSAQSWSQVSTNLKEPSPESIVNLQGMFIICLAKVLSKHTRLFLGKRNTVWLCHSSNCSSYDINSREEKALYCFLSLCLELCLHL